MAITTGGTRALCSCPTAACWRSAEVRVQAGSPRLTSAGSLNDPRYAFGQPSVLPSSDVLVAGGHDANVVDYASAELYDPATNRWTLTGSLNTSRRYPVQVGLANGEVPSPGYRGERSRPCCLYICANFILYTTGMDVAVSDLRAHLSDWLERARQGAEVIITDRGLPVMMTSAPWRARSSQSLRWARRSETATSIPVVYKMKLAQMYRQHGRERSPR